MNEQDEAMTKEEFKIWCERNMWGWLSDRPRSLEAHLLGVEEFVQREYNALVREKAQANTQ